jgi:hypothetical protein
MNLLVLLLVLCLVAILVWFILDRVMGALKTPPALKIIIECVVALAFLIVLIGAFGFGWWGPPNHWRRW